MKRFLTSYDDTQRQKRRQFMYYFKKINKILIFCYLMANIWISMFSYVENLFLRFLRLLEAFFCRTTLNNVKYDVNLCMILNKLLKSRVFATENRQYLDFDVFLSRNSVFEFSEIVRSVFDVIRRYIT